MPRWTGRRLTPISRGRSRSSRSASRSPIRFRRNDGSARRAPLRIQSARQRAMQEMLANPAVQGGLAPFIAALTVTALLAPFRLGGLAVVAAFATAVYFIAGFTFEPLTATRKIILLGFAAPLAGIVIDFAFRPTRLEALVLALAGAAAAAWIFWPILAQKDLERALLPGGVALLATAWTVGFSHSRLAEDGVRAGAAGLALGAGAGGAAILGASLTYGLYGTAVAAGSGAVLLVQMIIGRKIHAGATFMLAPALVTALPFAAAAAPESFTIDAYHSFPYFDTVHLGTSVIRGRFEKISGKLVLDTAAKTGTIELTVPTATLSTGDNDKGSRPRSRDEHLRSPDFFNVAEFPTMSYKGTATKWHGDAPATVEGQLTLLGVTRPVTLTVERWKCGPDPRTQGKRYFCGGNATGAFNRSDFGMKFIVGPVSDEVKLWISVEACRD